MRAFLEDAVGILETAMAAGDSGGAPVEMALLFDSNGNLRIVDSRDWTLSGLQAHYGARAIYRIQRQGGHVRVQGRCGGNACILESGPSRSTPLPGLSPSPATFTQRGRLLA